ncbi:hypothetical protein [Actinoplanes sp. NBRC 103695]|uniref:hypothetical protein n=1 Tax=Actinoplanes sp. NBRC 103695 TaxID=3032202 RepID=UPI0024A1EDED|nr:hypothetical protein [Actinoplanes sp. NBRC 103695]GLZ00542.1 hypothetical protein Acsp02_77940 [Actinoplanes sp. NBRC 103695]
MESYSEWVGRGRDAAAEGEALVCSAQAAEIAPESLPVMFNRGLLLDRAVRPAPGNATIASSRDHAVRALNR